MPEQSNDYRVVVFGAGGVGKSSLVLRFVKGTFRDSYIPTIEDTYRQVISCNKNVCTLQITDTTGSHQFPAMQRLNITKGHAFLLVFSITSKQSLEELIPVYRQILEVKAGEENLPIMLVGNKCDEESTREVTSDYTNEMVSKILKGCGFMETSAKTNHNVQEAFQVMTAVDMVWFNLQSIYIQGTTFFGQNKEHVFENGLEKVAITDSEGKVKRALHSDVKVFRKVTEGNEQEFNF